jgi:membrane-bound serine protease (ClpP class)
MILMPIIMVAPFLAILLFYFVPFGTALPIYIVILVIAGFCYLVMFKSMRSKAQTGLEAMIGDEAVVIEDIDPEGKVEIRGEIWDATARGRKFLTGKRVKISGARGLVLIVADLTLPEP